MNLYEMVTRGIGESYVRSYCWAESEERARELFSSMGSKHELHPSGVRKLFSATDGEFITEPTDHGFPDEMPIQ